MLLRSCVLCVHRLKPEQVTDDVTFPLSYVKFQNVQDLTVSGGAM